MVLSFLQNYMQKNIKNFISKPNLNNQYRHTTPHHQNIRNLHNYKDNFRNFNHNKTNNDYINDKLKFFLEEQHFNNKYKENSGNKYKCSDSNFFKNHYFNQQQKEKQYYQQNGFNEEHPFFKYREYYHRRYHNNNGFYIRNEKSFSSKGDEKMKAKNKICKIKRHIKPMIFYIYSKKEKCKYSLISSYNNENDSKNQVVEQQVNKNSNNSNSSNNKNSDGARSYHSSTNHKFSFIFSKTVRILFPIAMTGVRSWIGKGNMVFRFGTVLLILIGATGAYWLLNHENAPVTNRARLLSLTKQEEMEMGEMGYETFKKTFQSHFLPDDNPIQNRVREISRNLVQVTNLSDLEWECHVINSDMVNAMVLPNGKIFVFTGLFKVVENEDELAAVLGHEIGHVVARHSAERMSMEKLGIMFVTLTRGLVGDTITGNISAMISTNLINLKYSRVQELEADIIGLELMTSAKYNPDYALSVQKKLNDFIESQGKSGLDKFDLLSTHPNGEERITNIKNWIDDHKKTQIC